MKAKPLAGQVHWEVKVKACGQVYDQLGRLVKKQVFDQVFHQIWTQVCRQVEMELLDQLSDRVSGLINERIKQ